MGRPARARCDGSRRSTGSSRRHRRLENAALPGVADVVERGRRARRREVTAARDRRHARGREHRVRAARRVDGRRPRARSSKGQPVCVVETTKASIELESPGAGTLVQLRPAGQEVELGRRVARRSPRARRSCRAAEERARRAAAEAAAGEARQGDAEGGRAGRAARDRPRLDREGRLHHRGGRRARCRAAGRGGRRAGAGALLAGVSRRASSLPAVVRARPSRRARSTPASSRRCASDPDAFRALSSDEERATLPRRRRVDRRGRRPRRGRAGRRAADRARGRRRDRRRARRPLRGGRRDRRADAASAHGLELRCRRAFIGADIWAGRSIRIGGGGNRDPWATLAIGDLAFLGDEVFVNPCRPVLIGREVFVTMRSMIVTHNIGHSLLEGFENRFAPVVLEDRAQVGLGTVVYAGCRVGRDSIVGSNSYVVSDIPPGKLAIGVPAKVGRRGAARPVPRAQAGRARAAHASTTCASCSSCAGIDVAVGSRSHGFELAADGRPSSSSSSGSTARSSCRRRAREAVVLTLELARRAARGLRGARSARAAHRTATAACCSTRCASSAASGGSASSPARGATAAASSEPAQGSFSQGMTARSRGIAFSTAASPAGMEPATLAKLPEPARLGWLELGASTTTGTEPVSALIRVCTVSIDRTMAATTLGTGPLTSSDTSSPMPPPLTRRTAMTTPAPRLAATLAGTGLTMPPSTKRSGTDADCGEDTRNGRAGEQGRRRAAAAEHDFLVRVHVGRDDGQRYRRALQASGRRTVSVCGGAWPLSRAWNARQRGPEHLRSELVHELGSLSTHREASTAPATTAPMLVPARKSTGMPFRSSSRSTPRCAYPLMLPVPSATPTSSPTSLRASRPSALPAPVAVGSRPCSSASSSSADSGGDRRTGPCKKGRAASGASSTANPLQVLR